MFNILSKFGVPAKMVNLIKQLHTNVVAKFAIGTGDDETTTCTSGTKQGDPMAATLFLYVIQACLETIDLKGVEFQVPKDRFIGTKNHGPSGVKVERHRNWYIRELLSSLYADDAGVIFATRKDLEDGFKILYKHY